ncbi:Glycosyl transferases group 1 [Cribrihabitans marinus]|uniref:Glycosyl transferases group 1 n=1 Tax=Cribrihabitans marinus TaxID=1227549 RepID=A0A1H6XWZ0_9RHOB|nr:glycosyltransferase family 1 protein [Cribrihabitans marinus]GGH27496.1 hypothetical protein GCM10010973_15830 [Cribrihabitans marinus]SEJ29095.1 Glycosyl transferases group 1 [Cribrihabitans marinus]
MREPLYFFDISSLLAHLRRVTHFTGIQRVLVMLVLRVSGRVGPDKVYLSFINKATGAYQAVSVKEIGAETIRDPHKLASVLGVGGRHGRDLKPLSRYRNRPLKYFFHRTKLDIAAALGNQAAFRKYSVDSGEWRSLRRPPEPDAASPVTAQARRLSFGDISNPGDHLVILDSSWTEARTKAAFLKAKQAGVDVRIMIHDLIPIMAPELVPQSSPLVFYNWLLETPEYASGYLTNSEKSKQDLDHFLNAHGIDRPSVAVPLAQEGVGQDTAHVAAQGKVEASAFPKMAEMMDLDARIRAITTKPYVLFVGTLETRKNIWRMALAWEKLLEIHGPTIPRLVLVGRPGWLNEDFENFARGTGFLKGWIEQIHSPTDAELDFLYRHCEFSILVSLYEGWGLPVGEALSYGKTSVVGKATSLPEVGGDLVEYCDPRSVDSIAEACSRLIGEPQHRREIEQRIAAAHLRSWDDVAAELVEAIGNGAGGNS